MGGGGSLTGFMNRKNTESRVTDIKKKTGRLRIQRQAWRLTSVANVYNFDRMVLFVRRKR